MDINRRKILAYVLDENDDLTFPIRAEMKALGVDV